jgi:hypothetical protein
MERPVFSLNYQRTQQDFKEVLEILAEKRLLGLGVNPKQVFVFLSLLSVLIVLNTIFFKASPPIYVVIPIGICWITTLLQVSGYQLPEKYRYIIFNKSKETAFDMALEVTPEKISNQWKDHILSTPWTKVDHILEGDAHYIFLQMTIPRRVYILPKRAFQTKDEADAFFETAKTYWESARVRHE